MPRTIEELVEIIEDLRNKVDVLQRQVNYLSTFNVNNRGMSPPFMSIGDGACHSYELDL